MRCRCNSKAIYFSRSLGEWLCDSCFCEFFEKTVKKRMKEFKIENEKICVGISGGKDSTVTLKILNSLGYDVFGIFIDEGIRGYREESKKIIARLKEDLPIVELSFYDEFGFTLDELVEKFGPEKGCFYCGIFRRYLLNKHARELKASYVATGHNLDDEIQSVFLSIGRGDWMRLLKIVPKSDKIHDRMLPRIKPLFDLSEKEVKIYSLLKGIPSHDGVCPYSGHALRAKIREIVDSVEIKQAIKHRIMASIEKLPRLKYARVLTCEKCGEPSSRRTCKTCEMLEEIRG
ncbi:MAG: TIGR00269 family protein [Candidatus Hydrothermarchaeota archaeon]